MLTDAQRVAVENDSQYLQILAGPGTGKTLTIARRIAHKIATGAAPSRIVAVTFTNQAAGELRRRLDEILGPIAESVLVTTYHGFCNHLVSAHSSLLDQGRMAVADEWDQSALCHGIGTSLYSLKRLKLAKLRKALETGNFDEQSSNTDLVTYNSRLLGAGLLDYEDLLEQGIKIAVSEDVIVDHLFADEFQDASYFLWLIMEKLAIKNPAMTMSVVGDPNQEIYKFLASESDVDAFELMRREFPVETVWLDVNFRSTQDIINVSQDIIAQKVPRSAKGQGTLPELTVYPSEEFLLADLARTVQTLEHKGYNMRDVAVVAYTNAEVSTIRDVLTRYNIAVQPVSERAVFSNKTVGPVHALLKYTARQSNAYLLPLLRNSLYHVLSPIALAKLEKLTKGFVLPIHPVLQNDSALLVRDKKRRDGIATFLTSLDAVVLDLKTAMTVDSVRSKVFNFFESAVHDHGTARSRRNFSASRDFAPFFDFMLDMVGSDEKAQPLVVSFLQEIRSLEVRHDKGVSVRTMHGAKGTEFRVVIVATIKNHSSNTGELSWYQDKKLIYVAVTRAKDNLILKSHGKFWAFENIMPNNCSRDIFYGQQMSTIRQTYPKLWDKIPMMSTGGRRAFHHHAQGPFTHSFGFRPFSFCNSRLIRQLLL